MADLDSTVPAAGHGPRRRPRRRALVASAALGLAAMGTWFAAAGPAHADAPVKDGWWTDLDQGSLDGSPALGVPSGGLQVSNAASGPSAISAVTFNVPDGSTVGNLKLSIAGNPVISSPPVACAVAANSLGYQPAQGGPMSAAPAYDCTTTVTATVDSGNTTATFAAQKFQANGQVAMVILAGGPADSITFNKPDDSALTFTPPPADTSGSGAGSTGGVPADSGTGAVAPTSPSSASPAPAAPVASSSPSVAPSSGSSTPVAAGPLTASTPSAPLDTSASPSVAPLPSSSAAPAAAAPAAPANAASGSKAVRAKPASSTHPAAGRKSVASVLGIAAVLAALVAYSEGYGILGGRVRSIGSGTAGRRSDGDPGAGISGLTGA